MTVSSIVILIVGIIIVFELGAILFATWRLGTALTVVLRMVPAITMMEHIMSTARGEEKWPPLFPQRGANHAAAPGPEASGVFFPRDVTTASNAPEPSREEIEELLRQGKV